MALDVNTLLKQMTDAAKTVLVKQWPSIQELATSQFKTLAQNMADIEAMKIKGTVTQEQAQLLTDMQKNTLKTLMLSEEGLGLLATEAAINAAIGVVSDTVNKAIGWTLL